LLRPLALLNQVHVTATEDGGIQANVLNGPNGKPMTFKEVAPLLFESPARDRLQFVRSPEGALVAVIDFPALLFQRVARPQDHQVVNLSVLGLSLAIMISVLLAWPAAAIVRRRYRRRLELSPRDRRLRIVSRLVLAWQIVALIVLVVVATRATGSLGSLNSDLATPLRAIQMLFIVGALGTIPLGMNAVRAWRQPDRGWVARLTESSALLATVGFVWILFNWNLLRVDLRF
jgi:hypothetical protein